MDSRLFFILGDHITCIVSGALVGIFSAWFFDPSWGMFSAMIVGMVLGMLVGFIFPGTICLHYFGLFELMVPLMVTTMLVGMVVSMAASMLTVTYSSAAIAGALIGIFSLRLTYRWNNNISGLVPGYSGVSHD